LYGAGHESRGWFCLDFKTGRQLWQAPGKGSVTCAGNRLYCLDEKGTITLVKATGDEWLVAGSFRLPRGGKGLYWAHPVVCGGRLYVRHSDQLFAYDIGRD
jgi:outer membrane protein assembly factor BamB